MAKKEIIEAKKTEKKSSTQYQRERRQKKMSASEVYVHGIFIFTDDAARAIFKKISDYNKNGIKIGKEAAIQSILSRCFKNDLI